MLTTNDADELAPHSYKCPVKTRVWRQINFELDIPYFLVNYKIWEGESFVIQTSLFWQLRDLLAFCEDISSKVDCSNMQVVVLSPLSINHEKNWKANNVKEIWIVKDPIKNYSSVKYVTTDNQCLFDPPVSNCQMAFAYQRILFPLSSCITVR